jgi:hypothetical protein
MLVAVYYLLLIVVGTTIVAREYQRQQPVNHTSNRQIQTNKDELVLFPDVAFQSLTDNETWLVIVHGWQYQLTSQTTLPESFLDMLFNRSNSVDTIPSLNYERLRPLVSNNSVYVGIDIRLGNRIYHAQTDMHGLFYEQIETTNDNIERLKHEHVYDRIVEYETFDYRYETINPTRGLIHLIESNDDISIISDFDDTIKISNVTDAADFLLNAFVLPFKPVPGN